MRLDAVAVSSPKLNSSPSIPASTNTQAVDTYQRRLTVAPRRTPPAGLRLQAAMAALLLTALIALLLQVVPTYANGGHGGGGGGGHHGGGHHGGGGGVGFFPVFTGGHFWGAVGAGLLGWFTCRCCYPDDGEG